MYLTSLTETFKNVASSNPVFNSSRPRSALYEDVYSNAISQHEYSIDIHMFWYSLWSEFNEIKSDLRTELQIFSHLKSAFSVLA